MRVPRKPCVSSLPRQNQETRASAKDKCSTKAARAGAESLGAVWFAFDSERRTYEGRMVSDAIEKPRLSCVLSGALRQ